jgi:hypothetical protein
MEVTPEQIRVIQLQCANHHFYLMNLLKLLPSRFHDSKFWDLRNRLRIAGANYIDSQIEFFEALDPLISSESAEQDQFLFQMISHPTSSLPLSSLSARAKELHDRLSFLRPSIKNFHLRSKIPQPKPTLSNASSAKRIIEKLNVRVINLNNRHDKVQAPDLADNLLFTFWTNGWENGLNPCLTLNSCYGLHKVHDSKYVLSGSRMIEGSYTSICAIISKDVKNYHDCVLYDQSEIQHIVHYKEPITDILYSFGFHHTSQPPVMSVFQNTTHLMDVITNHSSTFGPDGGRPSYSRGAVILGGYLIYISDNQRLQSFKLSQVIPTEGDKDFPSKLIENPQLDEIFISNCQDICLDRLSSLQTAWVLTEEGNIYSISLRSYREPLNPIRNKELVLDQEKLVVASKPNQDKSERNDFFTTILVRDNHIIYSSHNRQSKEVTIHRVHKHTGTDHHMISFDGMMNSVHKILFISLESILGVQCFSLGLLIGEMKSITLFLIHESGKLTFYKKPALPSTNTHLYVAEDLGYHKSKIECLPKHDKADSRASLEPLETHNIMLAGLSSARLLVSLSMIL